MSPTSLIYIPFKIPFSSSSIFIHSQALSRYIPDPVRAMVDQNDVTLWNVYLYYAVNGNSADAASGTMLLGYWI